MTTPTVSIGAEQCLDPGIVGDKAARLAQARAAGLPVPDSVVVPCSVSAAALTAAARDVHRRGLHACRLDVMSADVSDLMDLVELAREVGPSLAVRSSAPLEDDPRLAGAYSSLIGVLPEELPTAVLAVWASAIRGPGAPPRMGVLIQPELQPEWAGTAERRPDGSVVVTAAKGGAQALTAGWATGLTSTVSPAGDITAAESPAAEVAAEVVRAAAALARDVGAALGDTLIEWAFADGCTWLIQSRHGPVAVGPEPDIASTAPHCPEPLVARGHLLLAAGCAGDFAERWILPWALGGEGSYSPRASGDRPPRRLSRPVAVWERLTALSDQLTASVWAASPGESGQISARLESLRQGGDPALADRLGTLCPLDPALARLCLSLAADLAAHLTATGVIASARQFWALPADLGPLLSGVAKPPDPQRAEYKAALRWEPLLYSLAAAGPWLSGVPVSPGTGCGPGIAADDAAVLAARQADWLPPRAVIVARYPLPRYSSLLMGAAGLVAYGGSEAAHLVTVARSLGVPAVLGCDLLAALAPGCQVAVDGTAGTVAIFGARGEQDIAPR